MTTRSLLLTLLLPALLAPALRAFDLGLPRKYRIPNGLRLVVREDHSMPLVGVALVTHAGAAHEEAGMEGASALLAQLWDTLDEDPNAGELARRLRADGGSWDAYNDSLYAALAMNVPASDVSLAVELASRALSLREFAPAHLERAREQLLRRLETRKDFPIEGGVLDDRMRSLAYGDHPLSRSPHGSTKVIRQLTAARLRPFLDACLDPSRAVLVLIGDVDAEALLPKVVERFGESAGAYRLCDAIGNEVEPAGGSQRVDYTDVEEATAQVGFLVPPLHDRDFHALHLVKEYLTRGRGSVLHRRLITREGRLDEVHGDLSTLPLPNLLTFQLSSTTDSVDAAVKVVLEECARLARKGIRAEELERVRRGTKAVRALARQSRLYQALDWATAELSASVDFAVDFNTMLDEVTPEDIRRVAARYLEPERAIVAALRPREAEARAEHPVETRTMAKGLRVAVRKDSSSDVVGVSLYLPGSMANEPPDKPGMAGLLEAMLAEGETRTEPPSTTLARLEENGGAIRGQFSGIDGVVLTMSATVYTFEELLQTLHDVVMEPRFDPRTFERVKRRYVEQWRDYLQNLDQHGFWLMFQTLFSRSPYGKSMEEIVDKVPTYTLADLRSFYADVLARRQNALAVVGNIAPEKVFDQVARVRHHTVDDARGSAPPAREWPPFVPLTTTGIEVRPSPRSFDTVWLGMKFPPESRADLAPLTVWFNILGLGRESLLERRVAEVDPAYQKLGAMCNVLEHGGGMMFGYRVEAGKGKELARALRDELAKLDSVEVSRERVEVTQRRVMTYLAISDQDKVARSAKMAVDFGINDRTDFQDELLQGYRKLRLEELEEARRRYMKHARIVVFEAE